MAEAGHRQIRLVLRSWNLTRHLRPKNVSLVIHLSTSSILKYWGKKELVWGLFDSGSQSIHILAYGRTNLKETLNLVAHELAHARAFESGDENWDDDDLADKWADLVTEKILSDLSLTNSAL